MHLKTVFPRITRSISVFLVFTVFFAVISFGCDKAEDRASRKPSQKSPGETVTAFYTAANKGLYTEAARYLSAGVLNLLKSRPGHPDEALKRLLDQATRDRSIEKIEIAKNGTTGEQTVVHYTLYFRDGSRENGNKILVREQKDWKLTTW